MKKWIIIFFFISSCILSSCGTGQDKKDTIKDANKDGYENIALSNNQLGFQLLSKLQKDKEENILISPFSLFIALSMVNNGADGETKKEIQKVLHTNLEIDQLNEQNKMLFDKVNKNNEEIRLGMANSIWLNEHFHFQDTFAQNMKKYYKAEIEKINIMSQETFKSINDWIKEKTNGKIEKIVERPLDDKEIVSILINAIYFKGQWLKEFDANLTENRTFYLNNQSIKEIPYMQQQNKWLYFENELFQAVSLPYKDGNLSMKVIMPKEQTKLEDVMNNMTNENWEKWSKEFSVKEGTVLIPKFQMKYEVDLNEVLKQLGMKSAFEKGANFNKLIKEKDSLWIDQIKQVSFIDVSEEGTEAAAATSVVVITETSIENEPFYMEVNRPFFLAVVDEKIDIILFLGLIQNPNS